jgi:REP element-mobilizing transposase RayT
MSRSVQFKFSEFKDFNTNEHGGGKRAGKRKIARPIATKRAMHVTVRAEAAVGDWSLRRRRNAEFIAGTLEALSKRHRVYVMSRSNNGNHLHLLIRPATRRGLQNFMRELTRKVVAFVTGAKKGSALKNRFWDETFFSRIVEWGRDLIHTATYVFRNVLEAAGRIPYQPRKPKPTPKKSRAAPKLEVQRRYVTPGA